MKTPQSNLETVKQLENLLENNRGKIHFVLPFDLTRTPPVIFDLSELNTDLENIDLNDAEAFSAYVFHRLQQNNTPIGIGKYDEDRVVYRHSKLFNGENQRRSVHLGIDLFALPGTPVRTPLTAVIHSYADNNTHGDYGPTIILEHWLEGIPFYTLYGHLSRTSLSGQSKGKKYNAGETIGRIGTSQENGNWPPHLHFQIIRDMGQKYGDFPGVATPTQRQASLALCPNPNLILKIPGLS